MKSEFRPKTIRKFNYTDRKRITHDRTSIVLNRKGNSIESFNATLRLDGMELPPDARVCIEAYHRTELQRYKFETVENIKTPESTKLGHLAYTENLKFRVLVVDSSIGKILATAEKISPQGLRGILPVDFVDLGRQIWLIEYTGDEESPILLINTNIPRHVAKSPEFIMYVYPAVLREILTHIVFVDRIEYPEEPDVEWHKNWLDFSKTVLNENPPSILNPESDSFDREEAEKWINKVVEKFCLGREKEWQKLIRALMGELQE